MLATRWRRNQNESVYTYFSLPYGKMGLKQKGQIKLVGIEILPWSGNNVRTPLSVTQLAGSELASAHGQKGLGNEMAKRLGTALVESWRMRERERERRDGPRS